MRLDQATTPCLMSRGPWAHVMEHQMPGAGLVPGCSPRHNPDETGSLPAAEL